MNAENPARAERPAEEASGESAPKRRGKTSRRPLRGRTVVITRAEDKGRVLGEALTRLGARVLSIPTIRFAPPEDPTPLREALAALDRFRWILFTSSTAVKFFMSAAREEGLSQKTWSSFRFGVVGPTTASKLASMGIRAEHVVIGGSALALGESLLGPNALRPVEPGDVCLLPQANIARTDLQDRLREAGITVETVIAYRTLAESPEKARPFLEVLERGEAIDGIAFASPSAFESFLHMSGPAGEEAMRKGRIPLFSIGPTTSQALRGRGFELAGEALPFTNDGLIHALIRFFRPPLEEDREEPLEPSTDA